VTNGLGVGRPVLRQQRLYGMTYAKVSEEIEELQVAEFHSKQAV
jgi:hypothetical protein